MEVAARVMDFRPLAGDVARARSAPPASVASAASSWRAAGDRPRGRGRGTGRWPRSGRLRRRTLRLPAPRRRLRSSSRPRSMLSATTPRACGRGRATLGERQRALGVSASDCARAQRDTPAALPGLRRGRGAPRGGSGSRSPDQAAAARCSSARRGRVTTRTRRPGSARGRTGTPRPRDGRAMLRPAGRSRTRERRPVPPRPREALADHRRRPQRRAFALGQPVHPREHEALQATPATVVALFRRRNSCSRNSGLPPARSMHFRAKRPTSRPRRPRAGRRPLATARVRALPAGACERARTRRADRLRRARSARATRRRGRPREPRRVAERRRSAQCRSSTVQRGAARAPPREPTRTSPRARWRAAASIAS